MDKDQLTWFPLLMNMKGQRCLVLGGGMLAERRVAALLDCQAIVCVISPLVTDTLKAWARLQRIHWVDKCYESQDLDLHRPVLIFALTNRSEVNRQVRHDATTRSIWVNDGSEGLEGSFIVPSNVRRGRLHVSVTSLGGSPGLVKMLRSELERAYGPEYETYVDFLYEMRCQFQEDVGDLKERSRLNRQMLTYPVLEMIVDGRFEAWRQALLDGWMKERRLP